MNALREYHTGSPAQPAKKFAARPTAKAHLMDDMSAREVHIRIADRLADAYDTIHAAIGAVNRSTYEAGSRDRKEARALVQKAWSELAVAARLLAEPAPRFRPDATGPRPIVRRGQADAEVDLRLVSLSLPARMTGVAR
jgi:hypothetical protein